MPYSMTELRKHTNYVSLWDASCSTISNILSARDALTIYFTFSNRKLCTWLKPREIQIPDYCCFDYHLGWEGMQENRLFKLERRFLISWEYIEPVFCVQKTLLMPICFRRIRYNKICQHIIINNRRWDQKPKATE